MRDRLNQAAIPAAIAGGTFVIGVGMAIGFRLAANSKDNQADDLRKKVGPNGCAPGAAPESRLRGAHGYRQEQG